MGHGGISRVARAVGVSLGHGHSRIDNLGSARILRSGMPAAWRRQAADRDRPSLLDALDTLVEPEIHSDLKTRLPDDQIHRHLTNELTEQGHPAPPHINDQDTAYLAAGKLVISADWTDVQRPSLTHCHEDHIGSAADITAWGDIVVYAHPADAPMIRGEMAVPPPQLPNGSSSCLTRPVRVDHELDDGLRRRQIGSRKP